MGSKTNNNTQRKPSLKRTFQLLQRGAALRHSQSTGTVGLSRFQEGLSEEGKEVYVKEIQRYRSQFKI